MRLKFECKTCKEAVERYECEAGENVFCSRSCAVTYNNTTLKKKPKPLCKNCGGSTARRSRKFCSSACDIEYKNKKLFEQVEKGLASAKTVKRYMIQKYGNVCLALDCAWDFLKKPINVELEHKDGNSDNNTLENCTLLCPNCHSTTPTFKAKNKGYGRATRRQRYKAGKSY